MRLTQSTIAVLESMAEVNRNIHIRPGNTLRSMAAAKNVLAEAVVDTTFTEELPIYDLNKFLKLYKCIPNAELTVEEGHTCHIHNGDDTISFRLSDASTLTVPPKKELNLPSEEVTLTLSTHTHLAKALKISKTMEKEYLAIVGDGEKIELMVCDKDNSGSDTYRTTIGSTSFYFTFFIKIENLKVMPGSYEVTISKKNLCKWVSNDRDMSYYIALEPCSTWSEVENEGYEAPITEEVEEVEEEVVEEPTLQPHQKMANPTEESEFRTLYDDTLNEMVEVPTYLIEEWNEEEGEELCITELCNKWREWNEPSTTSYTPYKGAEEATAEELMAMVE